ncbi:MAG: hypothetical protein HWE27_00830 [Gammaproteobacteria bacterium]|nr:hypothetical protein [Gammaproteobacteria bacterium]
MELTLTFSFLQNLSRILVLKSFAIVLFFITPSASAETAKNHNQLSSFCTKAKFQSESMSSDRKKGVSIASGNVELCNESFIIKSDKLTIERKQMQRIEASGSPVVFRQLHQNGTLKATSRTLILDESASIAKLSGSPKLMIPTDSGGESNIEIEAHLLSMKYKNGSGGVKGVWLDGTGSPVKISIMSDNVKTQLSANKAYFDFEKKLLTLTDNAFLQDETIELTAGELIFDLNNHRWTAPPSNKQRVTIKQRFGDSK